jgi:hypothetical protein
VRHQRPALLQVYLDADLELKQKILDKTTPSTGKPGRYRSGDKLLAFLKVLLAFGLCPQPRMPVHWMPAAWQDIVRRGR